MFTNHFQVIVIRNKPTWSSSSFEIKNLTSRNNLKFKRDHPICFLAPQLNADCKRWRGRETSIPLLTNEMIRRERDNVMIQICRHDIRDTNNHRFDDDHRNLGLSPDRCAQADPHGTTTPKWIECFLLTGARLDLTPWRLEKPGKPGETFSDLMFVPFVRIETILIVPQARCVRGRLRHPVTPIASATLLLFRILLNNNKLQY